MAFLIGLAVLMCNDQAIVSVFITIQQFQRILGFFDIPKGQGYFLGRKIVRTLFSVFGDFRARDMENCGFFCSGNGEDHFRVATALKVP